MKLKVQKPSQKTLPGDLIILPVFPAAESSSKTSVNTSQSKQPPKKLLAFERRFSKESLAELEAIDRLLAGEVKRAVQSFDFTPALRKRLSISFPSQERKTRVQTIRLSGLSANALNEAGLDEWRMVGGDALQHAREQKHDKLSFSLSSLPPKKQLEVVQAVIEGFYLAKYRYDKYKKDKSGRKEDAPVELAILSKQITARQSSTLRLRLEGSLEPRRSNLIGSLEVNSSEGSKKLPDSSPEKQLRDVWAKAVIIAQAVCVSRDLVNCPPRDLLPKDLVNHARKISGRKGSRISCRVYNRQALKRLGADALLAVAQGSKAPPYLIHLTYRPPAKLRNTKRVVLVGKGVTFDSGGLSIKTGQAMQDMKCDMAGAAAVLGVMKALASLRGKNVVRYEVHGIIPTVENMLSGNSTRPGDIVRALNGKTIEILNTDAEGRLILADALAYSARIDAQITIDLATLTGACITAVGHEFAGLLTKSEKLGQTLQEIGHACGENFWPLPLADIYRPLLDSQVADLKNIGPPGPGATIGALFLQEFVPKKTQWVHMDIAGPAFVSKGNDYCTPGGTGFGVRTLIAFLQK